MRKSLFAAMLVGALALGALVGWVDSRPGWDDTAITVGALLLLSAAFGAAGPRRAWLWALALGAWVPLLEIPTGQGPAPLVALAVALAGAYLGAGARRLIGGDARALRR